MPTVRAVGYAIDATSAYRYLPSQEADLWMQCFVWWEVVVRTDGSRRLTAGFCIDRRVGFGGAFAPNRFERVSLLVAALTQREQDAFDMQQPLPACAQQWVLRRRELQAAGRLPDGAGQLSPRYIQAYIDVSTDGIEPG